MLEVYPAGEQPVVGASSKDLSRAIRARGRIEPVLIETRGELLEILPGLMSDGDILLTMGAGDVGNVAQFLASSFPQVGGGRDE